MSRLWVLAAALAAAGAARAGDSEPHIGPAGAWVKAPPLPASIAAPANGAAPAKLLLVDSENRYGPDGDETYFEYAGEVLTPDGLSALGGLSAEWNPDVESVTINKLQIIRGGSVIDRLPIDKFITLRREANLEKAMLDGQLTAAVQVTDLQVGDIVDFAYTVTRKDPIVQGRSEGEQDLTSGFAPTVLQYRDVWPSTKAVRWRATGGLSGAQAQPGGDGMTVAAEFDNLIVPKPPEGAPPRYKDVGHLEFTDYKDWGEVSALLAPLYQKAATLAPASPLRAEIAKIKAASGDPEVETSLALRLVQDQVRYEFVGMDNGGYNPAPADLTWARRFGDCKGKTALLLAILNGLGIQAEPVMVNTEWGDALGERLPKLGVFDHVLVRAVINGRAFWLDGTGAADREVRDLSEPAYGWGLPVRASGATLERMAGEPLVLPKGETVMTIDSSAGLDEPPPVTVETVLHGDVAVLFGRKVGAISHDEAQKGFTNAWTKNYAWVDVKSVDWSYDAATGEFRFSMKGVGKPGSWSIDTPSGAHVFEIDSSAFSKPKALTRTAGPSADVPFAVDFPGYERAVTLVRLPDGGEGFSLVGDNFDETIDGVQYRRVTRFEHGAAVMTRSIRSLTSEVPAAQAKADSQKLAAFDTAASWIRGPLAPDKRAQDVQSLVSRGFDLLSQERPDKALALFDQALAGDPALVPARVGRATVFADKGDWDNALHEYDRAAQTSTDPLLAIGRGGVLFAAGRYDQAIQVYSEALARGPDPSLYRARAEAYAAQDRLDRAMQDAEAAIRLAPADPEGYSLRADLNLGARKPAQALEDYDRAVQIAPDDSDNLVGRGLAYAAMRQYDRALAELDEAARADPAAIRPLQARAETHADQGRFDEALRDLDAALAIAPGSPVLLNTRCWLRAGWGQQLDLALADCEAALKAAPGSAAFLDSRGLAYLRLGKLDAAVADYDAALKSSPRLATSLYGRGLAKLRKGDATGGRADLAAAHTLRPDIAETFDRFGLKP